MPELTQGPAPCTGAAEPAVNNRNLAYALSMGEVLLVILPALILAAVLWAFATALRPRDFGMSDAERYQLELAARSQAHYAAQVQAATAARARVDAVTRPSQNEQQQFQHGYQSAALPGGQLNPQLTGQLQSLVRSGKKVQAIKLLRQATHSDLLTAKNYVDRL
jgi:ribosomal protein L7/L12